MTVRALGYIGLGVKDIAAWRVYAEQVLGVQAVDTEDGGLRLRCDSRGWRIAVEPTGEDDITFAGWEVAGPAELAATIARLEAAGTPVTRDDGALAEKREVRGIASFTDPSGMVGELYWGPTERTEMPFVSPVGVRGFVTGHLGLGHIVVGVEDMDATCRFYGEVLGFRHSDHIFMRIGPDMRIPVDFWHCNPRHHTLAFAPSPPDAPRLIHFMLQVTEFDDVGFALDRAEKHDVVFATTLGRHANDHMLSFYAYTPSGFEIEYGYGAREIDDANWLPVRHMTTSSWGHKYVGTGPQRG